MSMGLLGRKVGMTRVFTDNGQSIPVTVLEIAPNRVSQIKSVDTDGYSSVQLTTGSVKASRVSKPEAGHFAKSEVAPGSITKEFRIDPVPYTAGQELCIMDVFDNITYIDVTSTSKGKGIAGAIKRHNFSMQDATHGNSLAHRAPGSIGQNQSPGRVFKGKKMAGHMGAAQCTVQNIEVVKLDVERNLMLVKGAVPGAPGAEVMVKPAVKKQETKS